MLISAPSIPTTTILASLVLLAAVSAVHASETSNPGVIEGVVVMEGDILRKPRAMRRGVGLPGPGIPWRDGVVPYTISDALTEESLAAIGTAIDEWNAISGVSLVPLESLEQATTDYINFQPGAGCASWVGRQGGEQAIWIAPSCTAGSVMHEIGHALGLEHEHTRADRDAYIRVNWDNIDPDRHHNFKLAGSTARMFGPYDFNSIMHYGPDNFSTSGAATIEPVVDGVFTMGQRLAPSAGDIEAIAMMYQSDLSVSARSMAASGNRSAESHGGGEWALQVTNNHAQGAHDVEVVLETAERNVIDYDGDGWICLSRGAGVKCSLSRLAGGHSASLHLVLDGAVEGDKVVARVSSKTPDADLSNNESQGDSNASDAPTLAAARNAVYSDEPTGTSTGGGGATGGFAVLLLLTALGRQRRISTLATA